MANLSGEELQSKLSLFSLRKSYLKVSNWKKERLREDFLSFPADFSSILCLGHTKQYPLTSVDTSSLAIDCRTNTVGPDFFQNFILNRESWAFRLETVSLQELDWRPQGFSSKWEVICRWKGISNSIFKTWTVGHWVQGSGEQVLHTSQVWGSHCLLQPSYCKSSFS